MVTEGCAYRTMTKEAVSNSPFQVATSLRHGAMTLDIGQPAWIRPGDVYPAIVIESQTDVKINVVLTAKESGKVVFRMDGLQAEDGRPCTVELPGTAVELGLHEFTIQFRLADESVCYDTFSFTVYEPDRLGPEQSRIAYLGEDGAMRYVPDYKGNRVPDFSNCGYMGGGVRLPIAEVAETVDPSAGQSDDTGRIQAAIDRVSALPVGADGLRGAVLLTRGTYRIAGTLVIRESGVVLRGEGQGEDGTILHAVGSGRRDIVHVTGQSLRWTDVRSPVAQLYVPAGAKSFRVADAGAFRAGDAVAVVRHGNAAWISAIDMDTITPRPNAGGTKQWEPFDLPFDRVITAIEGDLVTIDAPIAGAIDAAWGGGTLVKLDDSGRIEHVGVENVRVDSDFDPTVTDTQVDGKKGGPVYCADENHAVNFVVMDRIQNGWVRDVTGFHLEHSLVTIDREAKWVTVQDCTVREMISIITGGRRYSFHVTGQLNLVQRCDVETARHAFVVDARVCGPNVFLDSESRVDYNMSEPHHRWSVGGLYDNVRSPIFIRDRGWMGSGHGWSGACYVTWNTEGKLTLQQPPTAQNYAIGHIGERTPPFLPNEHDQRPRREGYWDRYGVHVEPRSLYAQQLKERLGEQAVAPIAKSDGY